MASVLTTTNTACGLSADGSQPLHPSDTAVKNGVTWNITNIGDAGAGNFYYIVEYSTTHNNLCYRIASFEHEVSTSATYGDQTAKIQAADAANKAFEVKLQSTLDTMVGTFRFLK